MINSAENRRAKAAAHIAISLAIVRESQPDDESLAGIAVEIVDDVIAETKEPERTAS